VGVSIPQSIRLCSEATDIVGRGSQGLQVPPLGTGNNNANGF